MSQSALLHGRAGTLARRQSGRCAAGGGRGPVNGHPNTNPSSAINRFLRLDARKRTRMIGGMTNIQGWFPTFIYNAPVARTGVRAFNRELLKECRQIRDLDEAGRRWCVKNYPGGYTSYPSMDNLHEVSSTFRDLERRIRRHVARFVAHLELDVDASQLAMTDCWVNMMPSQVAHSMHLHPLSLVSGTYYVNTPPGSPAIKFEDPRLDRFMFAPPRNPAARDENRQIVRFAAKAGNVILFESWLRHEVEAGRVRGERVSISFNYTWR